MGQLGVGNGLWTEAGAGHQSTPSAVNCRILQPGSSASQNVDDEETSDTFVSLPAALPGRPSPDVFLALLGHLSFMHIYPFPIFPSCELRNDFGSFFLHSIPALRA